MKGHFNESLKQLIQDIKKEQKTATKGDKNNGKNTYGNKNNK